MEAVLTVLAIILLASCVIALVLSVIMLWRNDKTFKYRSNMIDKISKAAQKDILEGRYNYGWRYEEYDAVSYHEMAVKFWKPLDSFYPRDPARAEQ